MTRNPRLCSLLLIVLINTLGGCAAMPAVPTEKPNILFIMVDDLGKEWISSYGAELIETPHIDALAETGMKFENAWCMPQCTPTRVTLLTGQYPFRHGWTNHWDVPRWGDGCHFDNEQNLSFARLVRDAGYTTAIAGKWQIDDFRIKPRALDSTGFDQWCMWTGYEKDNPPSGERYADPYIHTMDESHTHAGAFGPDVFCDYLIDFLKQHRDEPMMLYFPMALTHVPFVPTPDEPNVEGQMDRHKAMVRYTDGIVGRLVATLEELGLRDNTLIIFTTDNGTARGITGRRNGIDVKGSKMQMNEAGTAMPFIASWPARVHAGTVSHAITDFTDLFPTFIEASGAVLPADAVLDGQSILPILVGEAARASREWILSMGGGAAKFEDGRVRPRLVYDDRVLRDEQFKVWVDEAGRITRLHNMVADPLEETNLIGSSEPQHVDVLQKFRAVVATFPERDGIPRYTPIASQLESDSIP